MAQARRAVAGIGMVVLLASCGASTPPRESAAGLDITEIQDAARATVATGTAELLFSISFADSSTIATGTRLHMSGVTTFGAEVRQALQFDGDALGTGVIEFVVNGSDVYVRGKLTEAMGVPRANWLYIDLDSPSEMAQEFASVLGDNDASLLVYYLFGAQGEVANLGTETLDGVNAEHVGVSIDMDLALSNVPDDARTALTTNIAEQRANGVDPDVAGEAWIGSDGLVRRVAYTFQLSSQSGGGTMSAVVDLTSLGVPFEIDVPSDSEVIALDDLTL